MTFKLERRGHNGSVKDTSEFTDELQAYNTTSDLIKSGDVYKVVVKTAEGAPCWRMKTGQKWPQFHPEYDSPLVSMAKQDKAKHLTERAAAKQAKIDEAVAQGTAAKFTVTLVAKDFEDNEEGDATFAEFVADSGKSVSEFLKGYLDDAMTDHFDAVADDFEIQYEISVQ